MSVTMLVSLLLLCLGEAKGLSLGTAPVSGTAILRCNFANDKHIPWEWLALFWQRGKEIVVSEMNGRELITKHITSIYRERTRVLDNYDLEVYNVTLDDQGEYECVVQEKMINRNVIHNSHFQLNVYANFTTPRITPESSLVKKKNGSLLHLNCSSEGGFPEPETMYWSVTEGTFSWNETRHPLIIRGNKTFSISSQMMREVKRNISVRCILKAHHDGASREIRIEVTEDGEVQPEATPNVILIICIVILVTITILSIFWAIYKNRRKCKAGSSQRNGGVETGQRDPGTGISGREEESTPMAPAANTS